MMNFKRKLLIMLISLFIIPFNVFAYSKYVVPGGENIGINIKTNGVLVVGFYDVDGVNIAEKQGLRIGDKIVSINNKKIASIEELSKEMNSDEKEVSVELGIIRNNEKKNINLKLIKEKSGIYKTGMYVKDSITGIGTITFITENNMYGALGHEIIESSTNDKFEVRAVLVAAFLEQFYPQIGNAHRKAEVKADTAVRNRQTHTRHRGHILGDRNCLRIYLADEVVCQLQIGNRLGIGIHRKILGIIGECRAEPMIVVNHRGDSVKTEAVEMIFVQPEF